MDHIGRTRQNRGPGMGFLIGRSQRLAAAVATSSIAAGLLLVSASPAQAVAGYSAAGSGLALRSAPSTAAAVITRFTDGQPLDIECQTTGAVVNGSAIWDKISGTQGYVSDYFVNGTPYAAFDSRLPRCSAPVQPAPAAQPAPSAQTPAWTGSCAWPRCRLYLNQAASKAFANFAYTPSVPGNIYFAVASLFTASYRYIGKLWVDQGYCLAFQASAYPWETQGMYGYRC